METIKTCQQCKKPLPPEAPEGLCPSCLARAAVGSEPSRKSDATLAISPEAFVRVRYFGDYELIEQIARGGMGVVWKARQASLNRLVAIKMILAGKLAGEAEVKRFRREAEAAANLRHPNIVAIHEVGEHEGQHYYSMDYIPGRDLASATQMDGPLAPADAARCLKTIAEAIDFAHQRGTLHRDLKPQNILIDESGWPHVTDFGLAKFVENDDSLTQTGAAMGSPCYMPPEQALGRGDQIGPQSDVYSLGAILYELLTGRPPFRGETPVATMREVVETDPVPPRKVNPGVPADLETICLKCLEKNPLRRYHSARALAGELDRFLNHEPIQALPASPLRKLESWGRRHPWTIMAAVAGAAMVLCGLLYWQYERVQFLEHSVQSGASPVKPDLHNWNLCGLGAWYFAILGLFLFRKFGRQPESVTIRKVCALCGSVALFVGAVYFAKLIRVIVWQGGPRILDWGMVYGDWYFGAMLLWILARDYRRQTYGGPEPGPSAKDKETVRQALRSGDFFGAAKRFRKLNPGSSLTEAYAWAQKFAREEFYREKFPGASEEEARQNAQPYCDEHQAEFAAKYPQRSIPKLADWNWRLAGLCLLVEAAVFAAGAWLLDSSAKAGVKLPTFSVWFVCGVLAMILMRVKTLGGRFAGLFLIFTTGGVITGLSHDNGFSLFGFVLGASLMTSAFTPKRR